MFRILLAPARDLALPKSPNPQPSCGDVEAIRQLRRAVPRPAALGAVVKRDGWSFMDFPPASLLSVEPASRVVPCQWSAGMCALPLCHRACSPPGQQSWRYRSARGSGWEPPEAGRGLGPVGPCWRRRAMAAGISPTSTDAPFNVSENHRRDDHELATNERTVRRRATLPS